MRKPWVRVRSGLLATALVVSLAGVTSAFASRASPAAAEVEKVKIIDFAYSPKTLRIDKGEKVRWINKGDVAHTTTSNTDVWDSGALAPKDSFTRKFKATGTFKYHCEIHPSIKGKIIVE